MANVLHRVTKEYRQSVDTPLYDPIDWIINPDLTGLEIVPVKYWVIEGDLVREMTDIEKAQVDIANPDKAPFTGKLSDGTPAYLLNGSIPVSISHLTTIFSAEVSGAKNFRLDCGAIRTFQMVRDAVIVRGSASAAKAEDSARLALLCNGQKIAEFDPNEIRHDLTLPIKAGDELEVEVLYGLVTNPTVEIEFAWRD